MLFISFFSFVAFGFPIAMNPEDSPNRLRPAIDPLNSPIRTTKSLFNLKPAPEIKKKSRVKKFNVDKEVGKPSAMKTLNLNPSSDTVNPIPLSDTVNPLSVAAAKGELASAKGELAPAAAKGTVVVEKVTQLAEKFHKL